VKNENQINVKKKTCKMGSKRCECAVQSAIACSPPGSILNSKPQLQPFPIGLSLLDLCKDLRVFEQLELLKIIYSFIAAQSKEEEKTHLVSYFN